MANIVDSPAISEQQGGAVEVEPTQAQLNEEKVEVVIKEIVRINPRDFSAFKHAFEAFVSSWDK